jgi:protoporphyrinogen/coproporphyrinogen III oxidase
MTVAVIAGGGISGLVAARDLALRSPGQTEIILAEADDRLGGKLQTHRYKGAAIEAGPDWFLSAEDVMVTLCRELKLEKELVAPATSGVLIWEHDQLKPMPRGFVRGVPTSIRGLLSCRNLSAAGKLRAIGDLALPGPLQGPDTSVADLVRRRFGPELLERVVDPILAASRSGTADRMSLAAATPEVDAAARAHRSVMIGLRRAAGGHPPSFRGLAGGMETITDALIKDLRAGGAGSAGPRNILGAGSAGPRNKLGAGSAGPRNKVDVRLRTRLISIEGAGRGYRLAFEDSSLDADAVVMALPAPEAAAVLRPLDAELASEVGAIRFTSAAAVSLVYPPGAVAPPAGAGGFLVPSDEGRLITAAAWYSAKWANARPDDGSFVMRCFAGRSPDDPVLRLTDEELVERIAHEVALATKVAAPHVTAFVSRWRHALPLYEVGHLERLARIERGLARHPGLALAGAGYRGSGLPDCVASGRDAAVRILDDLV